jgi:DinB superfamily
MVRTSGNNSECLLIADQLRRAFVGEAWHGPCLRELLGDVGDKQANSRPVTAAHTIWEITLHIEVWVRAARASMQGKPMPAFVENMAPEVNWPWIKATGAAAWKSATAKLVQTAEELAAAIEQFGDERLGETVPGRNYDFTHLLHGIVQHSLYHGGQIAILKKALETPA